MRPQVRIQVQVKPELNVRRPPRQLTDLIDTPEDEFRRYVQDIEEAPLFKTLLEAGAIRRVRTRGRVPREKYEEYMDVQLMQFLRQYRITRHLDWEQDFMDRAFLSRLPALEEKYGAPPERLRKMIEYYQRVMSEQYGANGFGSSPAGDEEPDYLELVPSRADVDMTDSIVLMREFVDTYGLTEQDFVRDFMGDAPRAEELAARYGAPLPEVEEILEALGRLHIVESFVSAPPPAPARSSATEVTAVQEVARVLLTDRGRCVAIQFQDDGIYDQRYLTSPNALGRIQQLEDPSAAEQMLLELQWINQRKTLLCRLILAVCNYQYRYFLTGDVYALKPLSQAEMARELGEDEATICRLLRDKFLGTPYGVIELRFLFQRKTDVVRRIVERHPDLTDNEIRRILETDYGTTISRRTVAYHRLKFQRAHANGQGS